MQAELREVAAISSPEYFYAMQRLVLSQITWSFWRLFWAEKKARSWQSMAFFSTLVRRKVFQKLRAVVLTSISAVFAISSTLRAPFLRLHPYTGFLFFKGRDLTYGVTEGCKSDVTRPIWKIQFQFDD